jgi:diguanylate cyclase (GGDEF)-like protein
MLRPSGYRTGPQPFSLRASFAAFALTSCGAIVAVSVADALHERSVASAVALRAAENLAESLKAQECDTLDAANGALGTLAGRMRRDGTSAHARARLRDTIDALTATLPRIHHLTIVDEQGRFIAGNSARPAASMPTYADRPYFRYHRAHRGSDLYISGPILEKLDHTWNLLASRRIDRRDGRFGGIAMASIDLSYFEQTYARVDVGRYGNITLFAQDGTILVRRPSILVGRHFPHASLFRGSNRWASAGWYTTSAAADGYAHLFAYRRLGRYPLIVRVGVAQAEYLADGKAHSQTRAIGLAVVVALIGVLAAALYMQMNQRKSAEDQLARLALIDSLTGLANRRQFDDVLEREWREARRNGLPLALLMIDVDFFKAFNDRYGHRSGDDALVRISEAIAAQIKRPGDLAARYGGEEFVVILRATDTQSAMTVAERLRAAVVALGIAHDGHPGGVVSVSIGLAAFVPPRSVAVSRLLEAADRALYDAKRTGRNRVSVSAAAAADLTAE